MDNNTFNLKTPSLSRGILVVILGLLLFSTGMGAFGILLGLLFIGYGIFEMVMFSQKSSQMSVSRPAWKKMDEQQPDASQGCGLKHYHMVDTIIGLVVGVVACAVYILTAEATASWWDCGEYIATANKLQVGHPPGAPSFQLLGRLFSMFSEPEDVAHAVNIMSAVCSGLTIMFLYWGITLLAKHMLPDPKNASVKDFRTWAVFAAGLVGAFAYCFSDSFWFSAVEGEVYAMSSFFTALVFWAILKWEEQSDDKHSMRWIVLISLLVGIAIGVHLLNLLTVPAIFYVVYFKKWPKVTWGGFLLTGAISFVTLALILWVIIPGIVNLDSAFDVFFVNTLGLPFNTGTIFYFVLIAAVVVWGLWYSQHRKRPMLNAALMSFAMLVIGYSTFFVLVIRANTNTPLNENCPKDAVSMRAYLGREQYGETPLLTGHYFTERPINYEHGYTKYVRGKDADGNDRYIPAAYEMKYVYDDNTPSHLLPRMWSTQRDVHPIYYRFWTEMEEMDLEMGTAPTMGDNFRFMNRYQFGWMYWRYFMWNFAGRQNDQQGHYFNTDGTRDYLKGNWISGIRFFDAARLGPQSDLPDFMANDKSRNVYFLLPLLLGLIGLIYHIIRHPNDAFIVLLMFIMTGMAIAFYLNMPPCQPRERDYAFVGSFSFFAIWIGLGVMGLSEWISAIFADKKEKAYKVVMPVVFVLCLLGAPVLMACQNWDDHDRSEKTAARDFAENYLKSIKKNGILVTFGDNDTFPLWYAQEVEGTRTDVRILNYTLSGMYWYVEQLYNKLYESDPLPFTLTKDFYGLGVDQIVLLDNEPKEDYPLKPDADGYYELTEVLAELRDHPEKYHLDDYFAWYCKKHNMPMYSIDDTSYYLPVNKVKMTLDIPALVKAGVVTEEMAKGMDTVIRWQVKKGEFESYRKAYDNYRKNDPQRAMQLLPIRTSLMRHELMLLDIVGTNNFKRDINIGYPKQSGIDKLFPDIMEYSIVDGLNYKLVPYNTDPDFVCEDCHVKYKQLYACPQCGKPSGWRMYTETSADYFLNGVNGKALRWGNLDKDIYIDPVSREQFVPRLYQAVVLLAREENEIGHNDKAQKLLDMYPKNFPYKNFRPDGIPPQYVEIYYDIYGDKKIDKVKELWSWMFDYNSALVEYYSRFDYDKAAGVETVFYQALQSMAYLQAIAQDKMNDAALAKKAEDILKQYTPPELMSGQVE